MLPGWNMREDPKDHPSVVLWKSSNRLPDVIIGDVLVFRLISCRLVGLWDFFVSTVTYQTLVNRSIHKIQIQNTDYFNAYTHGCQTVYLIGIMHTLHLHLSFWMTSLHCYIGDWLTATPTVPTASETDISLSSWRMVRKEHLMSLKTFPQLLSSCIFSCICFSYHSHVKCKEKVQEKM